MNNKLNASKFALAGGVWLSFYYVLITIFALINVPGFHPYAELLSQFYGPYGYSISWLGVIVGGLYGFGEGFICIGLLIWIYNKLVK